MIKIFRFLTLTVFLGAAWPLAAHAAETFQIDPAHTQVVFRAGHFGVSRNYGRFNDVSGTVVRDKDDPAKSSVTLTIKAESVDTNNKKRDDHLRGPDFLNAKQFPEITFKSTKVKKTGENTYDVTGKLTLHGATKEITIPFTFIGQTVDPWGYNRAGGEAHLTLKRSDFGVSGLPDAVGDEIELFFNFEGTYK